MKWTSVGESLYGKFGIDSVIIGLMLLVIAFFVSIMFGWLMPEISNWFYGFGFLFDILGIFLGIVGIIRDDLREKAIRAVIAGICFLILGIVFIVIFEIYIDTILG